MSKITFYFKIYCPYPALCKAWWEREIHFLVTQVKSFMFFQNENIELNQNATVSSQFKTMQLYKWKT